MQSVKRILVIEDQDLMRISLLAELKLIFQHCMVFGAQNLRVAEDLLSMMSFDLIAVEPGISETGCASAAHRLAMISKIIAVSPKSMHLVITSADTGREAENCKQLGILGYTGKVGLTRSTLESILSKMLRREYVAHFSHPVKDRPDICYTSLTPREQEIVNLMIARRPGVKRKVVYEEMGNRCGIAVCSAEGYFKQAKAKLQQCGSLPRGL